MSITTARFVGIGEFTFNLNQIEVVRIHPMPNGTWEVLTWVSSCTNDDEPFVLTGKNAEAFREWWNTSVDIWMIGDAPPAGEQEETDVIRLRDGV